ncbi:MAG: hypothetical protein J6331_10455 [Lentisphaeria bacterium]|nr:hypothetical protein [Lentisphaeria bacterium]
MNKLFSNLFSHGKKVLSLAAFSAFLPFAGAESFLFNSPEDWSPSEKISVNADGSIAIRGMGILFTHADPFSVDPSVESTLSGEVKAMPGSSDKDRYYVAFSISTRI